MGDLYAHNSGLGLLGGLPILIALFAAVYFAEGRDKLAHEGWYWACIIILRTGATNIADYLGGRRGLAIDRGLLSLLLALTIAALAWRAARKIGETAKGLPATDGAYWLTMLAAGVFGTAAGDYFAHLYGQGPASLGLSLALALALLAFRRAPLAPVAGYWLVVCVARTAGTALGDLLADSKSLNLGLPLCTALTGAAFCGLLLAWRSARPVEAPVAA